MSANLLMNPLTNARVIAASVNPADYHKSEFRRGDPRFVMHRSALMDFSHSPHRWVCGYETKDTKSTEWGSLVDCLVLTPQHFHQLYVIEPETYINDKGEEKDWHWASKTCKAWKAEHEGKEIIKRGQYEDAETARDVLMEDEQIREYIECSHRQVHVVAEYHDSATGLTIPVKVLIDLVPTGLHPEYGRSLADLKTCVSAALRAWKTAVFDKHYDAQAAMCYDAYTAATGEDRTEFRHIIQENYPPYEVGKRFLSSEFLALGRAKYTRALRDYCQCLAKKQWPRYDERGGAYKGWSIVAPDMWMETRMMESATVLEEPQQPEKYEGEVVP